MIPKLAIEKAIEGGWNKPQFYVQDNQPEHLLWQVVVLDRTFWIALGKALGWNGVWEMNFFKEDGSPSPRYFFIGEEKITGTDIRSGEKREYVIAQTTSRVEKEAWSFNARRFFDLLLQGKPTDEYWAGLLAH